MTTYVCGHRNPDTDSIVAAISYAALYNMLGENDYIPVRLGHLNDETKFLLNRFGFQPPLKITSVRTQVRDVEFDTPPRLAAGVPVSYAWNLMMENPNLTMLPITNEDDTLYGLISAGAVAQTDMQTIQTPVVRDAPILNVISALEGHILNRSDDFFESISGGVIIALPGSVDLAREIGEDSIILCGSQPEVVDLALERKAKCVILCQSDLGEKYRGIHSETCLISTPLDAWRAARWLYFATPVGRVARVEDLKVFHLEDYLDDVKDAMLKNRYRSFPILDRQEKVVGTISRYHLLQPQRKRIVLVDHNEIGQSVAGLDQAEVVAVIDHHRLADVQTGYPVYVRNEPVGSTNTIIATMFQENGLMPGGKLAGLMAAAIISDTVMFKSPTTTQRDRRMAERLAKIAGLDLEKLGQEVFSANSSDKSAEDLLGTDLKEFHLGDHYVIISQITTMDASSLLSRKEELTGEMERIRKDRKADLVALMITDVLREGTELLYLGIDGDAVRQALELQDTKGDHAFIPGLVSRKKQMVPALTQLWG